jgi:DNA-binding protein H-NS
LDLDAMDFDELWLVHEELTKLLAEKISAEKQKLERSVSRSSVTGSSLESAKPPAGTEGRPAKAQISKGSAEVL